ncbi:aspartate/glutamate racemase family protein [Pelagibius sp. CAU 1746]|uniref:maleate cis-trans isomerase family protein n=1 Tax=Pelagibius sp. CAU 1746 TaxID=3140370 RepID=UPI00325B641B
MKSRKLLGMLTPSSNTVLEPMSSAIVSDCPDITVHFGRFKVTEISARKEALEQFDTAPMIAAAKLLADAKVQSICWNGTSAGWLGFDSDRRLCNEITASTGIPATTSVLAMAQAFRAQGADRIGLVTPYLDEIQERVVSTFAKEGFECVSERHLNDPGNFSFSEISEDTIAGMVREVARDKPQAITIFCTNLRGARIVPQLEAEIGIPIFDTVSLAIWSGLRLIGEPTNRIKGWGQLFELGDDAPESMRAAI